MSLPTPDGAPGMQGAFVPPPFVPPTHSGEPTFHRVDVQTQHDVEQFLYAEAQLLDEHRYNDWVTLFTPDVTYWAPTRSTRPLRERQAEVSNEQGAAYFDDDYYYLVGRARRLESGLTLSEEPPSRTRRLITNVRITPKGDELDVRCNFYVYRSRLERHQDWFVGERFDVLRRVDDGHYPFAIAQRRILLDQTTLLAPSISTML